jgi:hypothetical protein
MAFSQDLLLYNDSSLEMILAQGPHDTIGNDILLLALRKFSVKCPHSGTALFHGSHYNPILKHRTTDSPDPTPVTLLAFICIPSR